jgi:hypothetical protein
VNGAAFNPADRVYPGDAIETGKSSGLYLKLDNKSYLIIYPETSLSLLKKNSSGIDLSLEKGAVYIYGMDGRNLSIASGNAVYTAGGKVRGWFYREGDGSGARLSAGEIDIAVAGTGKSTELRPGFGVDVVGIRTMSAMPLDQKTIEDLLFLEKAAASGKSDALSGDQAKVHLFSFIPSVWAESAALKNLSMEAGPLSTVTTISKKTYVGAVTVRGKYIEIRTLKGTEKVSSKDVQTVTRYQFL